MVLGQPLHFLTYQCQMFTHHSMTSLMPSYLYRDININISFKVSKPQKVPHSDVSSSPLRIRSLSAKQLLAMPPETAAGNCDVVRARSFPVTLFETPQKTVFRCISLKNPQNISLKQSQDSTFHPLKKEHDLQNIKNLCVHVHLRGPKINIQSSNSKLTSATPKISVEGVERYAAATKNRTSWKLKSGPVELEWWKTPAFWPFQKTICFFQGVQIYYITLYYIILYYIHRVVFEADFPIGFWPKADLPQLPSSCQSLVWRSHPVSSKYINK